jgi:hypothetical protein
LDDPIREPTYRTPYGAIPSRTPLGDPAWGNPLGGPPLVGPLGEPPLETLLVTVCMIRFLDPTWYAPRYALLVCPNWSSPLGMHTWNTPHFGPLGVPPSCAPTVIPHWYAPLGHQVEDPVGIHLRPPLGSLLGKPFGGPPWWTILGAPGLGDLPWKWPLGDKLQRHHLGGPALGKPPWGTGIVRPRYGNRF